MTKPERHKGYVMAPHAFLFDMDGLLIDSERVYSAVARDILVAQGHGAADVDAFFLTMVGVSGAESIVRLTAFLGSTSAARTFNAAWHAGVNARLAQDIPLRPTVRDSLSRLASQGARMAVVTSTNGASARAYLERLDLLAMFETVLGGDEVSARKPEPAPYLEAAAVLGLDPAVCAAFEDSDHGITAATRAGCRSVQIPDLRPPGTPLPDLGQGVAPDLWSAIDLVGGFADR